MPKKSVEKTEKITKNKKLQENNQINNKNKKEIEKKLEIKSIKLQNIVPFDEQGLTVNFGKKLNEKKANIHIFIGENGSGKSSIANAFDMILNFSKIKKNNDFDYRLDFDRKTKIKLTFTNGRFAELEAKNRLDNPPINYSTQMPDFITFAYSPDNFYQKTATNFNPNSGIKFFGNKSILEEVKLNDIANWAGNLDYEIKQNLHNEKRKSALDKSLEKIKEILGKDFEWGYDTDKREFLPKINDNFISFVSLSDGHKTTLSLFSDLLYRVYDNFKEFDDFLDKDFILILDEIDTHLHPKAQRRILPALQSLFPNAEIFCTTHSPFVVNSVSDAWVYELKLENGKFVDDQTGEILTEIGCSNEKHEHYFENYKNRRLSSDGDSYIYSVLEDFNIPELFGTEAQENLKKLSSKLRKKEDIFEQIEILKIYKGKEIEDAILVLLKQFKKENLWQD